MAFTSVSFFLFFALAYVAYWLSPLRARRYVLIVASLVFYAAWSVPFLLHFLIAIAINFLVFRALRAKPGRSPLLAFVVTANLLNLAFFKYSRAMAELLYDLSNWDWLTPAANQELILPLAISFYTFQMMALAIDAYRGQVDERIPFRDYALFVLFFPQLISGPIMRHTDFFHQLDRATLTDERVTKGLYLILFGIVKKVIVADGIAAIIDPVFADPIAHNTEANVFAAIGFSLQLYLDFSAYTDIARGVAKLLGYEIPENFRGPFFSSSFSEFWRRWHITLSTWLRDYLYVPLGGSRHGRARTAFNLFATMSLGGLWHGHDFTYLIWGMLEGSFLAIERTVRRAPREVSSLALRLLLIPIVFCLGAGARVFFRSETMGDAWIMLTQISLLDATGDLPDGFGILPGLLFIGLALHGLQYYQARFARWLLRFRLVLLPSLSLIVLLWVARTEHAAAQFIYFQF